MKFIRDIITKKAKDTEHPDAGKQPSAKAAEEVFYDDSAAEITLEKLLSLNINEEDTKPEIVVATKPEVVADVKQPAKDGVSVNIWDIDDDDDSPDEDESTPSATKPLVLETAVVIASPIVPTPEKRRPGRVKTRILGFEHTNGVVDLFDPDAVVENAWEPKFPVGWVVVIDGPGRGESFTLLSGLSQIGRGEGQAIQLNFGDGSISRNNHAAIAYDVDQNIFLFGHGGKSNIVRLNDAPVLSTETLKTGDIINIGETRLRFIAFCGEEFLWDEADTQIGVSDVTIT